LAKNIVKEKQPFQRLEVKKEDLLEMFKVTGFSPTSPMYHIIPERTPSANIHHPRHSITNTRFN
jgi:hypothetical protein